MAGTGNTQIINGQSYEMYSPAWYAARQAEAQRETVAAGTATGAGLKAAQTAAGLPPLSPATSSTSSTSSGSSSSTGTSRATVPPPSIAGLQAAVGGGSSNPAAPGGVQGGGAPGGGPSGSGYSHLAPVDTSAAESASFAKAKDQVGAEASGALTGLRSALGGRNLLGSGLEARATASAANSAAGELGDVSRQQAVTRADEAQKNASTNFQGDITQRGQDLSSEASRNSLAGELAIAGQSGAITQRGQDIQAEAAKNALAVEQAQLASQQRATALDGLVAALRSTSPNNY